MDKYQIKADKEAKEYFDTLYEKEKREDYFIFRLNENVRAMIKSSLKKNRMRYNWWNILNYTIEDLKQHLEKQFKDGMTWDNWGSNGWVIDHIIPISKWNITNMICEDFKRCWSLDNLQPLWIKENLKKSNKIIESKSQLKIIFDYDVPKSYYA